MNWRGFKIEVISKDYRDMIEIVPVCETDDMQHIKVGIFKDGRWETAEIESGASWPEEVEKHLLTIPGRWGKELQIALEKLFGSPKATATESELKATKYHLEDMRNLVFKGK